MGNFRVVLGVVLGAVALGLEGLDDLDVTLGSEGARVDEGRPGSDALLVNVESGGHVVERVADDGELLEEQLGEYVLSAGMDLVKAREDMALEGWIHLHSRSSCRLALGFAQVLLSEEELSVQVAHFDHVGVRQHDGAFGSHAQHREVLQQLASDCACPYHE